ncbi:hypothetical protein Q9R46_16065 [Paenibacillus sp. RRE4]|uniref:Uncharacterized protein n=1 Tax=Paenibacillus silvae TaxID=1325358 RepID=A0ABQ1Z141_9BACL|nr:MULTISPECIES: hypothetical protein [Paenibacillus]MDT0124175.1 hypothetical protein [Paenibacillus sp. RRE4]GGH46286.1 hypothetical protein GCM10008014_08850 [Paenibacillus silvae]
MAKRLVADEILEEWIDTYGQHNYVDYKLRALAFAEKCCKEGIITHDEKFSAFLLHGSIYSRITNCRYNTGMYKHVECEWENEEETFLAVLHEKQEFWLSWKDHTEEYMKNDYKPSLRPTIDRIDEKEGYSLNNIQVLTNAKNCAKATSFPHYLFTVVNTTDPTKQQTFRRFDSKGAALKHIGLPYSKSDTGRFHQVGNSLFLLQSEDVTLGRTTIEEYENPEDLSYTGSFSITTEHPHGGTITINRNFTYERMAIILKQDQEK